MRYPHFRAKEKTTFRFCAVKSCRLEQQQFCLKRILMCVQTSKQTFPIFPIDFTPAAKSLTGQIF